MSRGFTLVEVVIALALFGFVSLAVGALLESAARATREAESRERLLWAADTALDSLRRLPAWSSGETALDDGSRVRWGGGASGGAVELWLPEASAPWLVVPVGSSGAGSRSG